MHDEHYVVVTVECSHCKTNQKVHVNARAGIPQVSNQAIRCIQCDNPFKVMVPDKIIRGPFPT
jgi:hypothetical protein